MTLAATEALNDVGLPKVERRGLGGVGFNEIFWDSCEFGF